MLLHVQQRWSPVIKGPLTDWNVVLCCLSLWPPCVADADIIIMAALRYRAGHYIFALWFLSSFFSLLA